MKHVQRDVVIAAVLMLIFSTLACTHSLKEQTFTTPMAEMDLLIAGDASEYKDQLRRDIIDNYRDRANIRVVNIDRLSQTVAKDYHAILIIDTCLAWTRFNPSVLSFLNKPTASNKVVWFMTVDDTEERYQHNGVDAITAASVVANKQRVALQLIHKIDGIVSDKP